MAFFKPHTVRDYLELGRRVVMRKVVIVGVLVAVSAVGGWFVWRMPQQFTSSALILLEPGTQTQGGTPVNMRRNIEQRLRNLRAFLLSVSSLSEIMTELDLYPELRSTSASEQIVNHMRNHVQLEQRGSDSFSVSFTHDNAQVAQSVTDRLSRLVIDVSVQEDSRKARDQVDYLLQQQGEAKAGLEESASKIEQFLRDNPDAMALGETRGAELRALNEELNNADANLRAARDTRNNLQTRLAEARAEVAPGPADARVDAIEAELAAANLQVQQLLERYTRAHPDVAKAEREVGQVKARLAAARAAAPKVRGGSAEARDIQRRIDQLDVQIRGFTAERARVTAELRGAKAALKDNPRISAQQRQLEAERKRKEDHLEDVSRELRKAQASLKATESQRSDQFRIQDPASLPTQPSSPPRIILLAAVVLVGLVLGVTVALLLVYFDQTVYNEYELSRVTDLPVLVSIARYKVAPARAPEAEPS